MALNYSLSIKILTSSEFSLTKKTSAVTPAYGIVSEELVEHYLNILLCVFPNLYDVIFSDEEILELEFKVNHIKDSKSHQWLAYKFTQPDVWYLIQIEDWSSNT